MQYNDRSIGIGSNRNGTFLFVKCIELCAETVCSRQTECRKQKPSDAFPRSSYIGGDKPEVRSGYGLKLQIMLKNFYCFTVALNILKNEGFV